MSRYRISEADRPYAEEFRRNLEADTYYHSPGLQRVLNVMRGPPKAGKYVLIVREPHARWALGRMPAGRGEPVEIVPNVEYTDLKQAEWDVFCRRWKDLTGADLGIEGPGRP